MKKRILFGLLSAGAVVLSIALGCDSSGSPTAASNAYTETETGNSVIVGDSMLISTADRTVIDTSRGCSGSVVTYHFDTVTAGDKDTMRFFIDGTKLYYNASYNRDTLTGGAVILKWPLAVRQGSGSGLMGTWSLYEFFDYCVVSGTLTAAERDTLNAEKTASAAEGAEGSGTLTITSSSYTYTYTYTTYAWADSYVEDWNTDTSAYSYSAHKYNITATKLTANSYSLRGNVNGETVTISRQEIPGGYDYTKTFTSTNAAHPQSVYYSNPTTCPNNYQPSWYSEFMLANYRSAQTPLGKSVAIHSGSVAEQLHFFNVLKAGSE